jgi:two-component system, NtrC family, sensor histidine kinase AtoS
MIAPAACILYTQESDFVRRTRAYLRGLVQVRHVAQIDRLDAVLEQNRPALLLLDLRGQGSGDLLTQVKSQWPDVLIIAFGTLHSDPLRDAAQANIYAAEDVNLERRHFQSLIGRALNHLHLLEENRALRADSARVPIPSFPLAQYPIEESNRMAMPMLRFPRVLRRVEDSEPIFNGVVEDLADTARVTRVGMFGRNQPGEVFRLRAGLRCLPETYDMEYPERDPLLRWFELHAHLVYRPHLAQKDYAQRELLRRALDTVGAEVIVPLQAGGRISGWLFFGHRLTGQPFDQQSLEMLMLLGEQVSTMLENARLNGEVARQKTLAETLLAAIPPGIVACDQNGLIRWCNPTAESILGVAAADVLNRPIETAGSRIAAALRETLESELQLPPQQWIDGHSRRSLSVQTRRLNYQQQSLGAVAVIQDLTPEESLREKQELVDRAAFWTDLAASMSHEVRNPLVAIKTFAQLLPERFDDPDFRRDFNEIVVQEIDRLDLIITQINNFAHPPELHFKPLDLRAPMKRAIELVRARSIHNGFSIETSLPDDLPRVVGDETALAEAFAHLVTNAAEATHGRPKARITLTAKPIRDGTHTSGVVVTVYDNGRGIAAELRDKIFSPFCTTKPRGMGLGLPIVKRTVFDHNGRVDVDSNPQGTSVSVLLPAVENGA